MKTRAHASLTDKAYRVLVDKIVSLELPPGSVLTEGRLMQELRIGRTPIREAIQRLIVERLVTHLHHRGMLVAEIRAADVQQIIEFRTQVEGLAARLAASRMSPEQIEELQKIHAALDRSAAEMDIDTFVTQDRAFHTLLARGAQNRYVEDALSKLYNLHLRLWYFLYRKQGGLRETVHEHQELIEALVRRDGEASELAMRSYVMRIARQMKDVI
jgi:GntR family transcriptional regulator, rspAB operon transcriptional repressor